VIRVEHLDLTLGGHFRPQAHVAFGAPLRTSGLLAALPPEAVKDLLLLLTFVTPNGHCAPTVGQIAAAMRVSPGKARSRLERLEALRWQAQPLLWHGSSESGLEFFSPLSLLAPVREDAAPPSAYVPPPPIQAASREAVIAHSRATYARPRAEVEAQIEEMMGYRKAHRPSQPAQAPAAAPTSTQGVEVKPDMQLPALSPDEIEAQREREEVRELLVQAGLEAEQAEGLLGVTVENGIYCTLSGSSGKLYLFWSSGQPQAMASAMPFPCAPAEGMPVLVPVRRDSVAGDLHLIPTLEASSGKGQRVMDLPPRLDEVLDEVEVRRFDGLEDKLPAWVGQRKQQHVVGAVGTQVVQDDVDPLDGRVNPRFDAG